METAALSAPKHPLSSTTTTTTTSTTTPCECRQQLSYWSDPCRSGKIWPLAFSPTKSSVRMFTTTCNANITDLSQQISNDGERELAICSDFEAAVPCACLRLAVRRERATFATTPCVYCTITPTTKLPQQQQQQQLYHPATLIASRIAVPATATAPITLAPTTTETLTPSTAGVPTINSNNNNQRSDIPLSHRWPAQQPLPLLVYCQPRMTVTLLFLHRLGIERYWQIPAERQRWSLTDSLLQ